MVERKIAGQIKHYCGKFPVVTLTGVRQCGKSTLLRFLMPDYEYVSLEDPDIRGVALEDPRGFLSGHGTPLIIDEAQRAPELFSYIQTIVDSRNKTGEYILSGSHNFLLMQEVSQSLAGRSAVLHLAPFSIREMKEAGILPSTTADILLKGGYPAIYDRDISPEEFFPSYIETYIERDVRLLRNITDIGAFIRFVRLLAARSARIVNFTQIATECGVNVNTVKAWLSVLESSNIIFFLPPYYKNFSKRVVKSPKLYFYDSGLLCYLLNIVNGKQLLESPHYGAVFETMVVSEYLKSRRFSGKDLRAYYFRDTNGNEIDLITEDGGQLNYYEIKASETMNTKYLKTMQKIGASDDVKIENMTCIYGGDKTMKVSGAGFVPFYETWQSDA